MNYEDLRSLSKAGVIAPPKSDEFLSTEERTFLFTIDNQLSIIFTFDIDVIIKYLELALSRRFFDSIPVIQKEPATIQDTKPRDRIYLPQVQNAELTGEGLQLWFGDNPTKEGERALFIRKVTKRT